MARNSGGSRGDDGYEGQTVTFAGHGIYPLPETGILLADQYGKGSHFNVLDETASFRKRNTVV